MRAAISREEHRQSLCLAGCEQRALQGEEGKPLIENNIQQKDSLKIKEVLSKKVAMTYSPTNLCSTIGAVGLNFSVRNGKRWNPNAIDRLNIGK